MNPFMETRESAGFPLLLADGTGAVIGLITASTLPLPLPALQRTAGLGGAVRIRGGGGGFRAPGGQFRPSTAMEPPRLLVRVGPRLDRERIAPRVHDMLEDGKQVEGAARRRSDARTVTKSPGAERVRCLREGVGWSLCVPYLLAELLVHPEPRRCSSCVVSFCHMY